MAQIAASCWIKYVSVHTKMAPYSKASEPTERIKGKQLVQEMYDHPPTATASAAAVGWGQKKKKTAKRRLTFQGGKLPGAQLSWWRQADLLLGSDSWRSKIWLRVSAICSLDRH